MSKRTLLMIAGMASLSCLADGQTNQQSAELSNEIVSGLIETHAGMINTNLLMQVCKLDNFLILNADNSEFESKMKADIVGLAKVTNKTDYDLDLVYQQALYEFRSFVDGVRYGASISGNLKNVYGKVECNPDMLTSVAKEAHRLSKDSQYKLNPVRSK